LAQRSVGNLAQIQNYFKVFGASYSTFIYALVGSSYKKKMPPLTSPAQGQRGLGQGANAKTRGWLVIACTPLPAAFYTTKRGIPAIRKTTIFF
jgi:hypothetical protein